MSLPTNKISNKHSRENIYCSICEKIISDEEYENYPICKNCKPSSTSSKGHMHKKRKLETTNNSDCCDDTYYHYRLFFV
ncbi:MAG: hypothetical protein Satyrvirus13_1 [Satyrvirus sp.]|uniref:Uncharacterized protein n=1 Tax=Satyrvirus sp. TaxID=2487771 RepID=A0A3G5AE14_9VIRU|nr:MAG: hypothetical protein Satyrvirus13_1 [Satyrvirus sp.]